MSENLTVNNELYELRNWLKEDYTYWVHEGGVFRSPMGENDFLVEQLGPGGWTLIP